MRPERTPYLDLRQIPLTALKAFEAAGRHSHIRRAAQELHVSHSALSRHIRQLEARLGVNLFHRESNGVQLTPAGRRLLVSVQSAFMEINRGLHYMNPDQIAGELIIACTATISMNWLLPLLTLVQQQYPEITLRVKTVEPLQENLSQEFDIALTLGAPTDKSRVVRKLYDEYYVPVCSPKLVNGQRLTSPSALLAHPLLHDRLNQWSQWCASHGLDASLARQHTYFDYAYQAIEAARLGMGLALADIIEVRDDIQQGRLMQIIETGHQIGESVYLVTEPKERMNQRTLLVLKTIISSLEKAGARLDRSVYEAITDEA
ncbi:LysR substrate-binding domain-containing protein [Alteromonas gilva]|uniref:LysR substrate-binding domain-containing protein n=1 Tax=Alteromonas gilva TaxID=2987522 RepID=A0ABT5L4G0_9ALTE|nr:LysR substrate-binding domain-containing protein [Alteromonas gilva]MDC8831934.1 LysR substrate-binding domain-containing protein [Alteromonas gilva]